MAFTRNPWLVTAGAALFCAGIVVSCSSSNLSGTSGKKASSKSKAKDGGKDDEGDSDTDSDGSGESDSDEGKDDGGIDSGNDSGGKDDGGLDSDSENANCDDSAALADPDPADCKIVANGKQATKDVYSVVLTEPAPCDFTLPTVSIGGRSDIGIFGGGGGAGANFSVKIGTYWNHMRSGKGGVAHNLPLVDEPSGAPEIDNGFMMVQPDHKTYLLVDAGMAKASFSNAPGGTGFPGGFGGNKQALDAATIAGQVSETLGFGETKLLQPKSATGDTDKTRGTVFKKGSVIALYDDTPDMGGSIDVEALIAAAKPAKKTCKGN